VFGKKDFGSKDFREKVNPVISIWDKVVREKFIQEFRFGKNTGNPKIEFQIYVKMKNENEIYKYQFIN